MPRTDAAFGAAKAAGQGGPVPAFVKKFAGLYSQTADALTDSAWTRRTITAIDYDSSSIVTLASSVFTLAAGTYLIDITTAGRFNGGGVGWWYRSHTRLRNNTTSTTALIGTSINGQTGAAQEIDTFDSRIYGRVTPTATNNFELQQYAVSVGAMQGGAGASSGETDRFVRINIIQIA